MRLAPNEHSEPGDLAPFTEEMQFKYTMWEKGFVKAIIYFHHNGGGDWAGFFLISKMFTARNGVAIKKFIKKTVENFNPVKLWTISLDCPAIEKWHKFLSLKREDDFVMVGEQKYYTWSMLWDGKHSHY